MMDGQVRRAGIIDILRKAEKPLSGVAIGKQFGISRQVVVQDVALLRAEGYDVLATARGYILNEEVGTMCSRVLLVQHDVGEMEEELKTIIDNGGRVRNVIINHCIYGDLTGDLMLRNRRDIKEFVKKVAENNAALLSLLTDGVHMHTIEANTEEDLDIIEEELRDKGYLFIENIDKCLDT